MNPIDLDTIDIPEPAAGRRRRFTVAEKRRFLSEASRPGETVSSVGRRYGLSVSLLFRWRRQLQGDNARHTAVRAPTLEQQSEIESLRRQVQQLQQQLAQAEQLNQRVALRAEGVIDKNAMTPQRIGGSLTRDGEA